VVGISSRKVNFILDADIRAFFDTVDHDWLIRFVEHRIGDKRIIRLIQKMARGGRTGTRSGDGQRQGNGTGFGDLTVARQHLPALRPRSLG
jgi:RNA-directed DNA polymerase